MRKLMMFGVAMVALSGAAAADDYKRAVLSDSEQRKAFTEELTDAKTLTTADCGSTYALDGTGFNVTLPANTVDGCEFEFIVDDLSTTGSYVILNKDADNDIYGRLFYNGGATVSNATDTITFVSGSGVIGDSVKLRYVGDKIHGIAFSSASGALTFTAAQ